jgi:hypothetical protein
LVLDPKTLLCVLSSSEVGRLIHVQPNPREVNTPAQSLQLPFPKDSGVGMEVVDEVHDTRPHLARIVLFLISFQENVHFLAQVNRLPVTDGNSNVNQRHKVQILALD